MSFLTSSLSDAVTAALPTFGGAVDVIAVQQPDGSICCSEFHVRFGHYQGIVGRKPHAVYLAVNGVQLGAKLRLARSGTVYFPDADDVGIEGDDTPASNSPRLSSYAAPSHDTSNVLAPDDDPMLPHEQARYASLSVSYPPSAPAHSASNSVSDEPHGAFEQVHQHQHYHVPGGASDTMAYSYVESPSASSNSRTSSRPWWLPRLMGSRTSDTAQRNAAAHTCQSHQLHKAQYATEFSTCSGEHISVRLDEGVRVYLEPEPCINGCASCAARLRHAHSNTTRSTVAGMVPGLEHVPELGLELSLCGSLDGYKPEDAHAMFKNRIVDVHTFTSKPHKIAEDRRLMCRLHGKIYPWREIAPAVLGMLAFGPLHNESCTGVGISTEVTESASGAHTTAGSVASAPFPPNAGSAGSNARLRPTAEELAAMPLHRGRNELVFAYESPGGARQELHARLYLWHWTDKLVISDVDGTITRSDLMGHVMPALGRDWSHAGVAALYRSIANNRYKLVFLSSRGVALSDRTRNYLETLKQGTETLPDGPVIVAPDTLTTALYREVVRRTPHEFKIEALDKLRQLFPGNVSPFYAGFGNRDSDEMSYEHVGVPSERIFTINPQGEVQCNVHTHEEGQKDHDGSNISLPSSSSASHKQTPKKVTTTLGLIKQDIHKLFPANHHEPAADDDFGDATFWRTAPFVDAVQDIEPGGSLPI